MSDRLQEIRGRVEALSAAAHTCRIDDFYELSDPASEACARCEVHRHAEDDIAWLLEQVEDLTKRVRMYEVVKS